jgi:hypothetical protein
MRKRNFEVPSSSGSRFNEAQQIALMGKFLQSPHHRGVASTAPGLAPARPAFSPLIIGESPQPSQTVTVSSGGSRFSPLIIGESPQQHPSETQAARGFSRPV